MLSGSIACSDWEATTAWVWLHKLRRAMVPGRPAERPSGRELCRGGGAGPRDDRPSSRSPPNKIDLSAPVLRGFVKDSIAPASTVHTDGWPSYQGLAAFAIRRTSRPPAIPRTCSCDRVASLLKRWVLGTLQGGIARNTSPTIWTKLQPTHIPGSRPFYRLLEQAVQCAPTAPRSHRSQSGVHQAPRSVPPQSRSSGPSGNLDPDIVVPLCAHPQRYPGALR